MNSINSSKASLNSSQHRNDILMRWLENNKKLNKQYREYQESGSDSDCEGGPYRRRCSSEVLPKINRNLSRTSSTHSQNYVKRMEYNNQESRSSAYLNWLEHNKKGYASSLNRRNSDQDSAYNTESEGSQTGYDPNRRRASHYALRFPPIYGETGTPQQRAFLSPEMSSIQRNSLSPRPHPQATAMSDSEIYRIQHKSRFSKDPNKDKLTKKIVKGNWVVEDDRNPFGASKALEAIQKKKSIKAPAFDDYKKFTGVEESEESEKEEAEEPVKKKKHKHKQKHRPTSKERAVSENKVEDDLQENIPENTKEPEIVPVIEDNDPIDKNEEKKQKKHKKKKKREKLKDKEDESNEEKDNTKLEQVSPINVNEQSKKKQDNGDKDGTPAEPVTESQKPNENITPEIKDNERPSSSASSIMDNVDDYLYKKIQRKQAKDGISKKDFGKLLKKYWDKKFTQVQGEKAKEENMQDKVTAIVENSKKNKEHISNIRKAEQDKVSDRLKKKLEEKKKKKKKKRKEKTNTDEDDESSKEE